MRAVASLPLLFVGAVAQTQNSTYLTQLAQVLTSLNLADLAGAVVTINSTAQGAALLAELPTGNFTVFAPNNDAFAAVPSNISSNATLLTDIISYHIVNGTLTAATSPNNTVGRTFLNDPSFVTLEGNKSQVLVWNQDSNGTIEVLNQPSPVTVVSNATFSNLAIYVIDSILAVPNTLPNVLTDNGLTGLITAAESIPALVATAEALKGYTLFAPNNNAITAANSTSSSIFSNTTLLANLLSNHIIENTTYYSTDINTSENLTSAAGEPLTFVSNSSGLYVLSGNVASAKILQTDLITSNGVVHVIDTVLDNTASNPAALSSAYASATSIAGHTSSSSSASSSTSSQNSGQDVSIGVTGQTLIGLGVSALCVLLGALSII